jgi:hypothetical protein
MISQHIVWFLLTMVCVAWYSTITIYVAIKGATDIKQMLKRLSDSANDPSVSPPHDPAKPH